MKTTYVLFHGPINEKSVQNLMTVMAHVCQTGGEAIYFLFSTLGGSVSSGITLYNFLKSLPVELTIHNMGNVDSIGNAIFLAGKNRKACVHSTFMFHGAGYDLNNVHFKEQNLREMLASLAADEGRMAAIICDRTNINPHDARELFREARTKDASAALAAGIVHEVSDFLIPAGSEILTVVAT